MLFSVIWRDHWWLHILLIFNDLMFLLIFNDLVFLMFLFEFGQIMVPLSLVDRVFNLITLFLTFQHPTLSSSISMSLLSRDFEFDKWNGLNKDLGGFYQSLKDEIQAKDGQVRSFWLLYLLFNSWICYLIRWFVRISWGTAGDDWYRIFTVIFTVCLHEDFDEALIWLWWSFLTLV